MKRLALILLPLALAGCQTLSPEARVRDKLIEAGLKPDMARCMAERLVARLSHAQLRELAHAAQLAKGQDVRRLTITDLADRLRAIQDPQIVHVVTRAGIGCAIAG